MFRIPPNAAADILLLRHSYAASDDGGGDKSRPLLREGAEAAAVCAGRLTAFAVPEENPWRVIASSAKRTMQTAALLRRAAPEVFASPEIEDSFYNAPAPVLVAALNVLLTAPSPRIAIVAHNPGISDACRELLMMCPEEDIVANGRCLPLAPCGGMVFRAEHGILRAVLSL